MIGLGLRSCLCIQSGVSVNEQPNNVIAYGNGVSSNSPFTSVTPDPNLPNYGFGGGKAGVGMAMLYEMQQREILEQSVDDGHRHNFPLQITDGTV